MPDLLATCYPWLKALHVFSVILWMSAQIALPLLLEAHRHLPPASNRAQLLSDLEHRLIRRLLNPAILAAFTFGGLMVYAIVASSGSLPHWLGTKLTLAVLLSAVHGILVREHRHYLEGRGRWSEAGYRRVEWLDIGLLALVVALVITKPVF